MDDVRQGARRKAPGAAELRTVLGTLTDGIQVFDAAGRLVTRNAAAARLYELEEEGEKPTVNAVLSSGRCSGRTALRSPSWIALSPG